MQVPFSHPALLPVRTPDEAASFLLSQKGSGNFVLTLNLEMLARAAGDPDFAKLVAHAPSRVCDGIGGKLLLSIGHRGASIPRIPGVDLGLSVLTLAAAREIPVFLLGGKEGIAAAAAVRLTGALPGLKVAGCHHGYFHPSDEPALRGLIHRSGAEIVLVCLGSPRQEEWIAQNRTALPKVKLFLPLGGSLDVYAGCVPRAPLFFQKAGLEWLWRISRSPKRIERLLSALTSLTRSNAVENLPNLFQIQ